MERVAPALLAAALLSLSGCQLTFSRELEGQRTAPGAATRATLGKTTLAEALARYGAPDVIVQVGRRTRLYYAHFDSDLVGFSLSTIVSLPGTGYSPTILTAGWGHEMLTLARLDFGEDDKLVQAHHRRVPVAKNDGSVAMEDRIVSNFYEDRERVLDAQSAASEQDDDADDDYRAYEERTR